MKLFDNIREFLGFTPPEQRVILLLIGAFLAGWGIRLVREAHGGNRAYDYAAVDSEFDARSSAFAAARAESTRSAGIGGESRAGRKPAGAIVNLNTASKDELISLPGIGNAIAERIISYRSVHGRFRSLKDLGRVKGIGKKKLERLVPLCTTGK
jgi:competence protein ComEA